MSVNEDDHLRVTSLGSGANMLQTFERFCCLLTKVTSADDVIVLHDVT